MIYIATFPKLDSSVVPKCDSIYGAARHTWVSFSEQTIQMKEELMEGNYNGAKNGIKVSDSWEELLSLLLSQRVTSTIY